MKYFGSIICCLILLYSCSKQTDQGPQAPAPTVTDKTTINLAGNADSFNVKIEGAWTITMNPAEVNWLTISEISGTGNKKIYVHKIQVNPTTTTRTATLTITATGNAAQTGTITVTQDSYTFSPWSMLFGGSNSDFFNSAIATADGGYIAVGKTSSADGNVAANHGAEDTWVVKTDAAGNIIWEKTYGSPEYDEGIKIMAVTGGYVIMGMEGSTMTHTFLTRIEENGTVIWHKAYPLGAIGYLDGIAPVAGGGFIGAGNSDDDAVLMRIDADGQVLWTKKFGGPDVDRFSSVAQSADGNFTATGIKGMLHNDTEVHYSTLNAWAIKVDGQGNQVWEGEYGGSKLDEGYKMIATSDGGSLIFSTTESEDVPGFKGFGDVMLTKIDAGGATLWQKAYGTTAYDFPRDLVQLSDGSYILTALIGAGDGDVAEAFGNSDAWVAKLDTQGNIMWQKTIGTGERDAFSSISVSGNKLVFAGMSSSYTGAFTSNHGLEDAWISVMTAP